MKILTRDDTEHGLQYVRYLDWLEMRDDRDCEKRIRKDAEDAREVLIEERDGMRNLMRQILRDMEAQGVLIEWQTLLSEAIGESNEANQT